MEEINLTNPIEKTLSEKLSFAVDNSMDGVALLDPEGKYYYLNEVHLSMFGYQSDKELIGKTWQFIYGQEEIDRISQYLFPLLMANGKWSGETLGKSKTGEPVYQEISLTAMPDGGLICICRDIAQKKKNLLQLEIYERILKHSSLMAIQTNVNREIVWVNDAFSKVTGYTFEEAMGKKPGKLLHGKETDPATVAYMTKQISKGEVFSCEVVNYNKSGEPYWISINGQPLYSDKGEIEHFFAIQEDITVRKLTEKKMKENSLRLQYAMDAANGALWEWDIVNNTVFYSAQWKAILGYKDDELSNDFKEWESRVHPEDIERVVQSINDYLEGKTDGYKSYTRILHKDGYYLHWLDQGTISERDAKGKPIRMVGVAIDVSELKETQQKLKDSEERWRMALEGAGAGIWEWDIIENNFIFSVRHNESLGYNQADKVPSNFEFWYNQTHPDDIAAVGEALENYWKGIENHFQCDFRCKNKEGEYTWLEVRGVTLQRSEDGTALKMIGSSYNVQDKKIVESKLKDSERRWNFALEGTGAGIWDWNVKEDTIFYSPKAIEMVDYGAVSGDTPAERFQSLLHSEDRDHVANTIEDMINGLDKTIGQYRIKATNGKFIWVEDNAMVVERSSNGFPKRILGSFVDISNRKETEIELIRSKELAEALVKKERRFLANISHELRTPLHAVIGLSEQLSASPLAKKQKEYIGIINKSARHLLELISEVLDLSKIAEGKIVFEETVFSFTKVLNESIQLVSQNKLSRSVVLKTDACDFQLDHFILGDSLRLKQIFINILGNALKFTDTGFVEVEYSIKDLDYFKKNFQIRITDTGIGMNEDLVNRLFEDFTQGDESFARKFGGSGLGLSITKKLVEMMNGQINITSKLGVGTTVLINIPFMPTLPVIDYPEIDVEVNRDFSSLKVLVVEDSSFNMLVAKLILNKHNIFPDEATNGLEAINKLQSGKCYDLVFMDIQMPEMDGLEATQYIRKQLKLTLPIIALTANAVKEELDYYLTEGLNDYITKPFEEKNLIQKLAQWVAPS